MSFGTLGKILVITLVLGMIATVCFGQEAGHGTAVPAEAVGMFNKSFAVGVACFGVAIGLGLIGFAAASGVSRNPGASGEIFKVAIIAMALVEAIGLFVLFVFKG